MFTLKHYAEDLINLLFPALCNGCGRLLYRGEKDICAQCLYDLPFTDFHCYADNPVAKQLWGRLPLNAAMAMLYFKKGTKVQNLMHSLKYKNQTSVGVTLGQLMGTRLKSVAQYQDVDLIIPVPLHQKKLKLRGYNQSEYIAKGLADEMGTAIDTTNFYRQKATESQTKKARYNRYENMQDVFGVKDVKELAEKHVLLVDDVITTGATLEACGNTLLNHGVKKIKYGSLSLC